MVQYIQENGNLAREMVEAFKNGQMEASMSVNGETERQTVKEN